MPIITSKLLMVIGTRLTWNVWLFKVNKQFYKISCMLPVWPLAISTSYDSFNLLDSWVRSCINIGVIILSALDPKSIIAYKLLMRIVQSSQMCHGSCPLFQSQMLCQEHSLPDSSTLDNLSWNVQLLHTHNMFVLH